MSWGAALPAVLLAVALLTLPGLVVALALGLRREALAGTSAALSVGTLTIAIILGSALHQRWGLLPVVEATALVGAVVWLGRLGVRVLVRRLPAHAVPHERPLPGGVTVLPRYPWAPLVLAAAAGVGVAWVVAQGMGSPDSPQQVYDAAFHVNAVQRVAMAGSASPAVVASTPSLGAMPGGFYPPLFHAVAGLLVVVLGVSPVVAANATALAVVCAAWPLSMAFLVASVAPRRILSWVAALVAMVTVPAAPYLFLSFGVLWPNALGIATVPACLVLVARVLGRARIHDPSLTVGVAAVAGVINAAGLYYAHPNAVFAVLLLALPLLVAWIGKQLSSLAHARGTAWAVGALVVVVLLAAGAWQLMWRLPQLAAVRNYDWPATMTTQQALGEALTLGIGDAPPVWTVAALAVVGALVALGNRWTSWLSFGFALTCYLYVLAAGSDDPISQDLTGFWYNDRWRVGSLILVLVPPLAATGVVWLVDAVRRYAVDRFALDEGTSRVAGVALAVVAVVVALWATPHHEPLHDPEAIIARGYDPEQPRDTMVTPGEEALYARMRSLAPSSVRVVGDPYAGAVYAGVLSGRQTVFPHFSGVLSPDQQLVRDGFDRFTTDKAVCAAVKRLRIGFAVGDTSLYWDGSDQPGVFSGVRTLEGVKGLTVLGRSGTATLYKVGGCRS